MTSPRNDERGQVLVLTVLALTVLLGKIGRAHV